MPSRAKIRLDTSKEALSFVKDVNSDGTAIKYIIEDKEGNYRVSARSLLGVLYASAEFGGELYLVNETNDNPFPSFVDKYRPLDENDGNYLHN